MKKKIYLLLIFVFCRYETLFLQTINQFGIATISTKDAYFKHIADNPQMALVEIKKEIPNIVLDLKYATKNNFTHHKLYSSARAFAMKCVVDKLKIMQKKIILHTTNFNHLHAPLQ